MNGEAREVRFQDLIDEGLLHVNDGYRAKHSELGVGGPIFLRAVHLKDGGFDFDGVQYFQDDARERVTAKMAMPGDTVVTTKGNSTGRTGYVSESMPPFVYSPHLSFWRSLDRSNLKPLFLRYWARGPEFRDQLNGLKESTDMAPYLSLRDQRRLRITLPCPRTQEAIGGLLGTLDDKIEATRALNETLEATCQALFRSWFVDFDPVVAKSEGRRPPHLKDEVAALFPDRFEDSQLGPVPAGWEPTTVGRVIAIYDSKRVPLSGAQRAPRPGPFPYYGAASVMDYIDDYLFDGIYLLVGEDGSVVREDGRAVTQYVWGKLWVNNHAHVLQGVDPICTEHLLLHFRQELITPFVTGAVQPKINQANLKSVPFIVPSAKVARCFARSIDPFFAKLRQGTDESQSLTALRDALLPRLLSGELRVRQAEKLVEEAV